MKLSVHLDTVYFVENWKLKTKNNKNNNNKLLFMLESTVHMPDCTVQTIFVYCLLYESVTFHEPLAIAQDYKLWN